MTTQDKNKTSDIDRELGFGPEGLGPRGVRRARRRGRHGRGDVRNAVLALVVEQPRHGYDLIKQISTRSGGAWQPSPGSVYPMIAALRDEGIVHIDQDADGRRIVALTETGEAYVQEHSDELAHVFDSFTSGRGEVHRTLHSGIRGAVAAARQVSQVGTQAQVAEAAALLEETKRRLYAILAQMPDAGAGEGLASDSD